MANRLLLRSLIVVTTVALAGCSDEGNPEPTVACNDLVNDGPGFMSELGTEAPTPAGGTIEDGRYENTAVFYYPDPGVSIPPDPLTRSGVFELQGGALQAVVRAELGDDEQTNRYSATYEASGTELTLSYACPQTNIELPNFTATPSELRLYYRVRTDTVTAELVLTKQ